jgi:drug/metabolite transporter (DMT)-like permease
MLATTPAELLLMLAAGLCNTVAFISLTKSLQLTSVVYVNALSAIQAMLAALVGVIVFHEKLTSGLAIGVALTIGGLLALAHAHRAMREPAEIAKELAS